MKQTLTARELLEVYADIQDGSKSVGEFVDFLSANAKQEAIEFVEWLSANGWRYDKERIWYQSEHEEQDFTSEQLYQMKIVS